MDPTAATLGWCIGIGRDGPGRHWPVRVSKISTTLDACRSVPIPPIAYTRPSTAATPSSCRGTFRGGIDVHWPTCNRASNAGEIVLSFSHELPPELGGLLRGPRSASAASKESPSRRGGSKWEPPASLGTPQLRATTSLAQALRRFTTGHLLTH